MRYLPIFFIGGIIILIPCPSVSQQNVGIGTSSPNTSAILELKSSNKGLLVPRINLVSETDDVTIPSPAMFLLIFNTNASLPVGQGFYFWNGAKWSKLITSINLSNLAWGTTGNEGTADTNFIGTTDNKTFI